MRIAFWIPKATNIHKHTHVCNTHCFSTATMATQTRLSVTLYVHQWRTEGGLGVETPSEIPKALQNRAKFNRVQTVKKC